MDVVLAQKLIGYIKKSAIDFLKAGKLYLKIRENCIRIYSTVLQTRNLPVKSVNRIKMQILQDSPGIAYSCLTRRQSRRPRIVHPYIYNRRDNLLSEQGLELFLLFGITDGDEFAAPN